MGSFDGKIRCLAMYSWQVVLTLPLVHPRDLEIGLADADLVTKVSTRYMLIMSTLNSPLFNITLNYNYSVITPSYIVRFSHCTWYTAYALFVLPKCRWSYRVLNTAISLKPRPWTTSPPPPLLRPRRVLHPMSPFPQPSQRVC